MKRDKTKKEAVSSVRSAYSNIKAVFKFRYPKLALLLVISIATYIIFTNDIFTPVISILNRWSYLSVFIAGLLFSFGFTTPLSIGFFLSLNPSNILLAALIGGLGAMLSDILIFKLIRLSFMDEFDLLKNTFPLKNISALISKSINEKIRVYIIYAFAGIIIASPLPDEIGVTMLAGLSHIRTRILSIISFIMNTLGILIMLSL